MKSYEKMYFVLFNKITDVINELQEIQIQAEEIAISQDTVNADKHLVTYHILTKKAVVENSTTALKHL